MTTSPLWYCHQLGERHHHLLPPNKSQHRPCLVLTPYPRGWTQTSAPSHGWSPAIAARSLWLCAASQLMALKPLDYSNSLAFLDLPTKHIWPLVCLTPLIDALEFPPWPQATDRKFEEKHLKDELGTNNNKNVCLWINRVKVCEWFSEILTRRVIRDLNALFNHNFPGARNDRVWKKTN